MAFLEVNGWAIPILEAGKTRLKLGDKSRSPAGDARYSEREHLGDYSATTGLLSSTVAEALKALLEGRGHAFRFGEGLQSFTGLQPEPGYAGLAMSATPPAPLEGALDITQGSFRLRYNAQLGHSWTVQWREYDGVDWSIATLTSGGLSYLDGVATAGVGSTATALAAEVLDGVVRLSYSGSGALAGLADLVVLPYDVATGMAEAFHATNYNFSPLPLIRVSGDLVDGRVILCEAKVSNSPFVQAFLSQSWHGDSKQVAFAFSARAETVAPPAAPPAEETFYLLQENGDRLLQENGDGLLQEF